MVRGCDMYSYFARLALLIVASSQSVQLQETTSAGLASSLSTVAESVSATTVDAFVTLTTELVTDLTTAIVTPTLSPANEDLTTFTLTAATADVSAVTGSSILSTTALTIEGTATNEAVTSESGSVVSSVTSASEETTSVAAVTTTNDVDNGSGTTDESTATLTSFRAESGSGLDTTTFQEGSGFTTTDSVSDASGSGDADVTTTTSSGTTITATSFEGSGNLTSTESNNATTVFEVNTDSFNTTSFVISTDSVIESAAGFPWYLIVIICLAVIIVLLIIIIIVVYCKQKTQHGPALLTKATPVGNANNAVAETTPKTLIRAAPTLTQHRPTPPAAPTIFPRETFEEPKMDFVSTSPMKAPAYIYDPSASVRKRDKARARNRPREPSFDDDEGFNEPLVTRDEKPSRRKGKRRKPPNQNVQDVTTGSDVNPSERTITYQPYFLPTPIQTALTGKALGDQLTDDAMAERHYLQRSDIERHQNKQRLRMQRQGQLSDSFKDKQKTIDAVLQPLPPKALQGIEERRRLQKHGLIDDQKDPRKRSSRKKPIRHDSLRSGSSDDTTTTEDKHAAHEKVIAKMSKLLEGAYALLAPAIQKNLVKPFNSGPPEPDQSQAQPPHDQRLFTRTNTPPVLFPQSGAYGHSNPSYLPGTIPQRSNDSQSPVWTPYRTFDRLQELQKQDPSVSTLPNTRPPTALQNIPIPNTPYQSAPPPIIQSHNATHNPFVSPVLHPIPGRAQPVPQQPDLFQMNQLAPTTQGGNPTADRPTNFIDAGVDEPTASIVQSIKDTLAELARTPPSDNNKQESNC